MPTYTVDQMMSRAKAELVLQHPFFANILLSMEFIETDKLNPPTMATNGKHIKYHPEFVSTLTKDELVFVLAHEVGHCIFSHMFRRGKRDPKRWNIAGDFIINDVLVADKVGTMPSGGLYDPNIVRAGGGTTDGVYDLLPEDGGKGGGGHEQFDTCEDAEGDEAEQAAAEADMKVTVAQAAAAAKMAGKLGEELERLVDTALKPKVRWQDVLRRFITTRAKVEYTYAKPKRRFLADDLYLPSPGGNSLGELVVAVDCSGSIGQKELAEFAAEITAIKDDCRPSKLHIIYFHHAVARVDTFEQDDNLEVRPAGSGGTAFSPIFAEIANRDINPVACVVLTDLECHDFGPQPEYPVLWVTTASEKAPWGDVVKMK